jgi:serine/threonine-protein kinase
VAIKRLHPHLAADQEIVAMLVDEARLVARIRHPNVVPTLDIVAEQGEVFLVMEYVQGESLASIARMMREKGGLPRPEIAATILAGVLHGLQAAHEAKGERGESLGIVHRDVSPQNILVGLDGVPRVVDFGVAKAVDRIGDTTGDGQLKGKLAYMPPEQVGGAVGPTTDVYAASVVLWETLTGRRLFGGGNQLEVYDKIMKGTVEPPSKHVPGLSPALDAVTMRGLSREPRDRYQTAREMALALEEASPMATASKIGAWVEAEAGATLRERARRVAEIDCRAAHPSRTSSPRRARAVTARHGRCSMPSRIPSSRAARRPTPPSGACRAHGADGASSRQAQRARRCSSSWASRSVRASLPRCPLRARRWRRA